MNQSKPNLTSSNNEQEKDVLISKLEQRLQEVTEQRNKYKVNFEGMNNRNSLLTKRLQEAELKADKVKQTLSFRIGNIIINSRNSFKSIILLPYRVFREIRRFKKAKKTKILLQPKPSKKQIFTKPIQNRFPELSSLFYKKGNLSETLKLLKDLKERGESFDKESRDFEAFVQGLFNLKDGWKLPPKQPNAGLFSHRNKLLYCLHQSVPHSTNGYSTRSHGVAVGLQQAGWQVNATTRTGYPWDAKIKSLSKGYHFENIDGVTYTACAGWDLSKTPLDWYLAETADHFMREAQHCGAEVIVAASNHITALPALMAARRLGLPFVYEVRGLWEVTQASTQPEWAGSERYNLMKCLETQVATEADLVMTLTQELADELVERGVDRNLIELAPNAVDINRFQPKEPNSDIQKILNLKKDVPVIGYAGSAVAYEGLELLLYALAILKSRHIEFQFVLVGDGKVIDTVKAKAKELSIEKNCRFTGRVPFEEIPDYLSCMDIMPIPRLSSAVTEMVSPLKPLEAMAMARAVVLSDVSPHKILAGNNERAQLFKKDSKEDLAKVLEELILAPVKRQKLGNTARNWVESERTWKKVTQDYSNYIQEMIERERKLRKQIEKSAKSLDQLTFGLIADQFTTDTLAGAVNVLPLSPENWRKEIAERPIDVMFVESAWKGNESQWHKKVGFYSEEEFRDLKALLEYCREKHIPSMFWNKEDPVHFDRFRKTAAMCDHVFTTDSRKIIPYLGTSNSFTQTASGCPFYATPKLHNLLPSKRKWSQTAAYGGTYYGKRYPERTVFMDKIMSAAAPLGLTIFDRQHDDPESPYKYPGGLASYVNGSLTYSEMIEAYKSHPLQINVNSVLDSPTMFSRRVMEVAACGTPVISGPALGMNRYIDNQALVINTETDAAEALEAMMQVPAKRWRKGVDSARAVMRAHTTELRLTQMLRTAGFVINAPQIPEWNLVIDSLDQESVKALLQQTHRPKNIICSQVDDSIKKILISKGIKLTTEEESEVGCLYLFLSEVQLLELEQEDIEDLVWTMLYNTQSSVQLNIDLEINEHPNVAYISKPNMKHPILIKAAQVDNLPELLASAKSQKSLIVHKPRKKAINDVVIEPKKTVVIAGHDLKFIKPFYPYFTDAGLRILLDFWSGHNQHNAEVSQRLLEQADTIFCEWTLGNAIWYGKHKKPEQKLIGRLHLQEIDHVLFPKIPFEKFEKVMFVGPHILRQGIAKNSVLNKNGIVVFNGVDVEELRSVSRKKMNGKVLGFVGIVPQRKRFDLALDILKELRKEDQEYTLRIKGKRPEDFTWMANRPEEMAWYESQYRRLEEDPDLAGAVFFDPHGNDMAEWYASIDYVLSTSDFESFHFTIADGAAAGCTPIILPWEGADEIYPKEWVCKNVKAATTAIENNMLNKIEAADFSQRNFGMESISTKIIELIKV
ncbi:MAG: glycosyltransferase [Pseudomonadota bacterium]|nr:glycosyltransferase [Pseudomonadota bacterium]